MAKPTPPSSTSLAARTAELTAIHAGWLQNPNPTAADVRAYLDRLRAWRQRHDPGGPPEEEPRIETPWQLWAWCRHRQEVLRQLEDETSLTMPPVVVGAVRFAWDCVRRLSGTSTYPSEPDPPRGYAEAIRALDHVIVWCGQRMGPAASSSAPGQQPAAQQQSPPVQLGNPGTPPLVLGRKKHPLTAAQYNVVKALLKAGPAGLAKDALIRQSGHSDAVNVLKRLARDLDWQKVIHLAGTPGMHYRIG